MLIKKHERVDGARAAARSLRSLSKRVVITDVWTEKKGRSFSLSEWTQWRTRLLHLAATWRSGLKLSLKWTAVLLQRINRPMTCTKF